MDLVWVQAAFAGSYLLALAAMVIGMVPVPELKLRIARNCFLATCAISGVVTILWGVTTKYDWLPRDLLVFFCVGVAAVASVETFRYFRSELQKTSVAVPTHPHVFSPPLAPVVTRRVHAPTINPIPRPEESAKQPVHLSATTKSRVSVSKKIIKTPVVVQESQSIERPSTVLQANKDSLILYNRGTKDIYLMGTKIGEDPANMTSPPVLDPYGNNYFFLIDKLKVWALATYGQNANQLVPFEIYVTDESKVKKFTIKCGLLIIITNGDFSVATQNYGVEDGGW